MGAGKQMTLGGSYLVLRRAERWRRRAKRILKRNLRRAFVAARRRRRHRRDEVGAPPVFSDERWVLGGVCLRARGSDGRCAARDERVRLRPICESRAPRGRRAEVNMQMRLGERVKVTVASRRWRAARFVIGERRQARACDRDCARERTGVDP